MEKTCETTRRIVMVLVGMLVPSILWSAWMEQAIPLSAGWNAVQLKVHPYEDVCDDVFADGNVEKLSWWNRSRIDDGTGSTPIGDFCYWYADPGTPDTFGKLIGGETYLIKAKTAKTLRIIGIPVIPSGKIWLGESNLMGANATAGVFWGEYFTSFKSLAPSPYARVIADGTSQIVPASGSAAQIKNGQAIWVSTTGSGEASYMGPIELSTDSSDKVVKWRTSTSARTITVRNISGIAKDVTFDLEDSVDPPAGQGTRAGKIALKEETIDTSDGYLKRVYVPVRFPFTTNLASEASFTFKVRPNLDQMPKTAEGGQYLGIIKVTSPLNSDGGQEELRVGMMADGQLADRKSPAGLWVGQVALTQVNRAQMLTSAESEWDSERLQDANQAFQFRLILHVADDGTVKLLKQAFIGSTESDDATAPVMADKETAQNYRDTHPTAKIRRVSSANFPFIEPLELSGGEFMTEGAELSGVMTQWYDDKTNPFLHRFHPNHDTIVFNNGAPKKSEEDGSDGTGAYESWNVTRAITLRFEGDDPTGYAAEDWGRTVTGGVYTERITGLNKTEIIVRGAFRLTKALDTSVLSKGGVAP